MFVKRNIYDTLATWLVQSVSELIQLKHLQFGVNKQLLILPTGGAAVHTFNSLGKSPDVHFFCHTSMHILKTVCFFSVEQMKMTCNIFISETKKYQNYNEAESCCYCEKASSERRQCIHYSCVCLRGTMFPVFRQTLIINSCGWSRGAFWERTYSLGNMASHWRLRQHNFLQRLPDRASCLRNCPCRVFQR